MATPTYDLLDSTTLGSSASSVTFTSISQSYRDLVLVINPSTSVSVEGVFNSDTGANYPYVQMYGNGSSAVSSNGTTNYVVISNSNANAFSITQIMDYSATDKHKTTLTKVNRADRVAAWAQRWANTSAITSITLSASFASGSTFHLYGISA